MRQADYPMGTTQATHDAHYNPTHDDSAATLNAIMRAVEAKAEDEIRTASRTFVEWLADYGTPDELARMLAFYKTDNRAECRVILDDLTARYQQYRAATLSADEQAEIAEAL